MSFPVSVQIDIMVALTVVAEGKMPDSSKPMKGFGSGVFRIAMRHQTDTYRVVYAVLIDDDVWIIHAFKKKSKSGIKTPKPENDLIRKRIKMIKEKLK